MGKRKNKNKRKRAAAQAAARAASFTTEKPLVGAAAAIKAFADTLQQAPTTLQQEEPNSNQKPKLDADEGSSTKKNNESTPNNNETLSNRQKNRLKWLERKRKRKSLDGTDDDKSPPPTKKRRRQSSYWVETCQEITGQQQQPLSISMSRDLKIVITRVELEDDHFHGSCPKSDTKLETVKCQNEVDAAEDGCDVEKKDQPEDEKREPSIFIVRAPSAKTKRNPNYFSKPFLYLPNGNCGDGIVNPHPKSEVADKYWAQRKRLFSQFDRGIQLDKESWYSVTPELIADHIAKRMVELAVSSGATKNGKGIILLDAMCGCGGNAIAFARRPSNEISLVICVDVDKEKLKMAAHNASMYNIPSDRLLFIEADASFVMRECYQNGKRLRDAGGDCNEKCEGYGMGGLDALPRHIDAVFLSPPWGGPDYENTGTMTGYCLKDSIKVYPNMERQTCVVNGEELLQIAANASDKKLVAYFLPRNINGLSVGEAALIAGYRGAMELEQNVLNGKLKTITAYFSDKLVTNS